LDLALGGIGTESAEINSTGQKLLKLCVAAPAGAVSVTTRILMLWSNCSIQVENIVLFSSEIPLLDLDHRRASILISLSAQRQSRAVNEERVIEGWVAERSARRCQCGSK